MSQQNKAILYLEAIFAVVIWGGTFIATKIALRKTSPATSAGIYLVNRK